MEAIPKIKIIYGIYNFIFVLLRIDFSPAFRLHVLKTMLHFLKRIFGKADPTDYWALNHNGTSSSMWILSRCSGRSYRRSPQLLQAQIDKLDTSDLIILCCTTGSRSGTAKRLLKYFGFNEVYNGAGLKQLQSRIFKS